MTGNKIRETLDYICQFDVMPSRMQIAKDLGISTTAVNGRLNTLIRNDIMREEDDCWVIMSEAKILRKKKNGKNNLGW